MMTTINELINKINIGFMTVSEAVDVVQAEKLTYGIKYFSPSKDQLVYWDMLREWNYRLRESKRPKTEVKTSQQKEGQLQEKCECGSAPVYAPSHLCEKCLKNNFIVL